MPRYFTHYWKNETWENERRVSGRQDPLDHVADNKFVTRGVESGDFLYPVTIMDGELYLLGRLQVGKVCNFHEAARILGTNDLWDATDHLIAAESTPRHFDLTVPLHLTQHLTFISGNAEKRLKFRSTGRLDPQTLRGVRELDWESAKQLDNLILSV